MVSTKMIAFAVLNILPSLVSMQNLCLEMTANVSKIRKSVQPGFAFILVVLSESVISLA